MSRAITMYQRPGTRELKEGAAGFNKECLVNPGDTEALAQAVEFDSCPARYEDGYRAGANFQAANCILADIDNTHSDNPADWINPDDFTAALSGLEFYFYPSRNHMKPKDGKDPRPKYHLIIPTHDITDAEEYTGIMKRLREAFPALHFDESVSNAAQMNFGVEGAEVTYVAGEMNLTEFIANIDVIPQGQRNSHMCSYGASVLKRYGNEDGRAYKAFIEEAAKCSPPLDDSELTAIWGGVVKFYNEKIKVDPEYVPPEQYEAAAVPKDGGAFLSKSEMLLKLFEETGATLFHNDVSDTFAAIPNNGHTEIWALDDGEFKTWLSLLYHRGTKKLIGTDAVKQVISALSARAIFENPEPVTLSVRVAQHGNAFYYDLTDAKWQVVKITAAGWKIDDKPPILFRRYRHQLAQIMPRKGGDVKKVLRHINIKDDYHILFMCWLVCCFIPGIPHPVLIFHGEKGSAKTTASGLSRAMVDPSKLETLTLQNDQRSLAVNLQSNWFLPFDNVSYISEKVSDALCRAVTGGGIQQRKLYFNGDDYIFTFQRCLAINGISNVATKPDLLDRSILIELVRIQETDRRELADVLSAFEADRADILGGIFDTLAQAMAIMPTLKKLDKLPRMADFARWGYAIGEALGGYGEKFLAEYTSNRDGQNLEAINADPIATLIVAFMQDRLTWQGLVSELLVELINLAPKYGIEPRAKGFPKQPNALSKRLKDTKSNLEAVGLWIEKHGNMHGMNIFIKNANSSPLAPYTIDLGKRNGQTHGGHGGYGDEIATPSNGGRGN